MPLPGYRLRRFAAVAALLLLPVPGLTAQELEILAEYETEMAAITADPRVAAALDDVLAMDEQNERLLIELTEIEAPPFKEEKRAAHYRGLMREAGFDADLDEIGNVVARRDGQGGGRTVAVVAHVVIARAASAKMVIVAMEIAKAASARMAIARTGQKAAKNLIVARVAKTTANPNTPQDIERGSFEPLFFICFLSAYHPA